MRVVFSALLLALFCGTIAPVQGQSVESQEAATAKIGVIDVQRLLTESDVGKKALDDLKTLGEAKQQEALALQSEIEDLRKRLTEGRLSLSEEKIAELEKQGEERLIAFNRFQDDADRELQKARLEAFDVIEKRVIPIIDSVGREFGYTAIFNKFQSGLLFAQEHVDITSVVLERFNTESAAGS